MQPVAEFSALQHFGFERNLAVRGGKDKAFTDGDFAAGAHQRVPPVVAHGLGEHHFDAAGWLFLFATQGSPCVEARRNHPAVIEDEQIAFAQQGREFAEVAVAQVRRLRDPSSTSGSVRVRRAAAGRSILQGAQSRNR